MNTNDVGTQTMGTRRGAPLLWFMIGSAVGAGIALLMAPASGVETRRRIGQTSRNLGSKVKTGVNRVGGHLSGLKEDVQSAVHSGRETFSRERDARLNEIGDPMDSPQPSMAEPRTP
jgi:gas vesicle protein